MRTAGNAGLALVLIAAALIPVVATAALVRPNPLHYEPTAEERAADAEAMTYYPAAAKRQGVEGMARLSCARDEHAVLRDCVLLGEMPQSAGFGDAALRLAARSRASRLTLTPAPASPLTITFCLTRPMIWPNPLRAYHITTRPDWLQRPDAAAIMMVYPSAALAAKVSGRAVLNCMIKATGVLYDCAVTYEAPVGQGFGEAALELTGEMLMKPQSVDGEARDGGVVLVPVVFGDNPPPPPPPTPRVPPPVIHTIAEACQALNP